MSNFSVDLLRQMPYDEGMAATLLCFLLCIIRPAVRSSLVKRTGYKLGST